MLRGFADAGALGDSFRCGVEQLAAVVLQRHLRAARLLDAQRRHEASVVDRRLRLVEDRRLQQLPPHDQRRERQTDDSERLRRF